MPKTASNPDQTNNNTQWHYDPYNNVYTQQPAPPYSPPQQGYFSPAPQPPPRPQQYELGNPYGPAPTSTPYAGGPLQPGQSGPQESGQLNSPSSGPASPPPAHVGDKQADKA